ncbi:hypothetical protein PSH58_05550 [Pseudomonas hefeiensis]|uniref:Uncharacterized protein n=1 Tax=Pseudomonas hefeiensis TaxID=2738125 RepID=A0ABY9GDZ3_9PSED|nr:MULTISPECIES: hypothetical protein [unclassified Pseudomonas]WLH13818.1 hypothetical protein PSH57_05555 [Pseudomonas sp. FP205]WLH96869.1 hypothetical protein PSH58_05550 [Pseudomonas sp. FP53]WLI41148.1 hypothetical protein PSH74_05550 [Pseudomonas sp. FP821]
MSALVTFAWAGFRIFESDPPSGRNPKQPLPQQRICTLPVWKKASRFFKKNEKQKTKKRRFSLLKQAPFFLSEQHCGRMIGAFFRKGISPVPVDILSGT